jgi:hypothetical protein
MGCCTSFFYPKEQDIRSMVEEWKNTEEGSSNEEMLFYKLDFMITRVQSNNEVLEMVVNELQIMKKVLECFRSQPDGEFRDSLLGFIITLAGEEYTNAKAIYENNDMTTIIKLLAEKGNRNALHLLLIFSWKEEVSTLILRQHPDIVSIAKTKATQHGYEEEGLEILINLCNAVESVEFVLQQHLDIIDISLRQIKKFPLPVVCILLNISNQPRTVRMLDKPNIIQLLSKKYTSNRNFDIRLRAVMILANIVNTNRERIQLLSNQTKILKYLVKMFTSTITIPPGETISQGLDGTIWRLDEVLQPIRSLSLVRKNRDKFVSFGILPLLSQTLADCIIKNNVKCVLFIISAFQQYALVDNSITTLKIICEDGMLKKSIEDIMAHTSAVTVAEEENIGQWTTIKLATEYLQTLLVEVGKVVASSTVTSKSNTGNNNNKESIVVKLDDV